VPGDRFKTALGDYRHGRCHPPDRIARYQMAPFEIQPEALLIKNGFPIPRSGSSLVAQDDFP